MRPDIARNGVGADPAHTISHLLGVAERPKEGLGTRRREGRKKVLQVKAQHNLLADVGERKGRNRMTLDKSMDGGVHCNAIENSGKNAALQCLQVGLRAFDQAHAAGSLRNYAVVVVTQLRTKKLTTESFQIGKPVEFIRVEGQPISEVTHGFDDGKPPLLSSWNGLHALRFRNP